MSQTKYIFIGGAHRSGTTLVQRVVGTHSSVLAGREFDFTQDVMALRDRIRTCHETGRIADLIDEGDIDHGIVSLFDGMFDRRMQIEGKQVLSEKTPSNALVLGKLCECLPQARCILVMRDPRAIAASMKTVGRKHHQNGMRPPPMCASVSSSLDEINSHWAAALRDMEQTDRITLVYYEDLVATPEPVIREICRSLDLPFEDEMLAPAALPDRKAHHSDQYWFTKEKLEQPISTASLKSYEAVLAPSEIRLVERFAMRHPALDRYGIPSARPGPVDYAALLWQKLRASKHGQKLLIWWARRQTG